MLKFRLLEITPILLINSLLVFFSTKKVKLSNKYLSLKLGKSDEIFDKKCNNDTDISLNEWNEVPNFRKIMLADNYCFDLEALVKYMTTKLNYANDFGIIQPKLPVNPYTQQPFTQEDISLIKNRILDNEIKIRIQEILEI